MRSSFVHIAAIAAIMGLLSSAGSRPGWAANDGPSPGVGTKPVITIFNLRDGDTFTGGQKKIVYSVTSTGEEAIDRIEVLVDGAPVGDARGVERTEEELQGPGSTAGEIHVPLPSRDVTVSLIAHAGERASAPATVKLVWAGPGGDSFKPKLYAVLIGVSRYTHAGLALRFAGKDATDFAAALRSQNGGLYGDVQTKVLTDAQATRANILNALEWLKREVTSNDLGIVYLAGHGFTDNVGNFWFLPVNATTEDLDLLLAKDDILRPLDALAGKALLFIDACHSAATLNRRGQLLASARGPADMDALIREFGAAGRGIVTFASSTGREISLEREDWGNGAFTKALVEGLGEGKAAARESEDITVSGLNYYVANRVKELTGGIQHPVMSQSNVPDFPLAIVRLAPVMPVVPIQIDPVAPIAIDPVPPIHMNTIHVDIDTRHIDSGGPDPRSAYQAAVKAGTRAAYQAVIDTFPDTVEAKLAANALARMPVEPEMTLAPSPPKADVPDSKPLIAPAHPDIEAWNRIASSTNPEDFESFQRTFPESPLVVNAKARQAQLEVSQKKDGLLPKLKTLTIETPAHASQGP